MTIEKCETCIYTHIAFTKEDKMSKNQEKEKFVVNFKIHVVVGNPSPALCSLLVWNIP